MTKVSFVVGFVEFTLSIEFSEIKNLNIYTNFIFKFSNESCILWELLAMKSASVKICLSNGYIPAALKPLTAIWPFWTIKSALVYRPAISKSVTFPEENAGNHAHAGHFYRLAYEKLNNFGDDCKKPFYQSLPAHSFTMENSLRILFSLAIWYLPSTLTPSLTNISPNRFQLLQIKLEHVRFGF